MQPLARLLPPGEEDLVLAPVRVGGRRDEDAVGKISYSPGSHLFAVSRACGETAMR